MIEGVLMCPATDLMLKGCNSDPGREADHIEDVCPVTRGAKL